MITHFQTDPCFGACRSSGSFHLQRSEGNLVVDVNVQMYRILVLRTDWLKMFGYNKSSNQVQYGKRRHVVPAVTLNSYPGRILDHPLIGQYHGVPIAREYS